jgi:hypothetical protein
MVRSLHWESWNISPGSNGEHFSASVNGQQSSFLHQEYLDHPLYVWHCLEARASKETEKAYAHVEYNVLER